MDTGSASIIVGAIVLASSVMVAFIQRGSNTTMELVGRLETEIKLLRAEIRTDIVEVRAEVAALRSVVIAHISSRHG